jgi:hypothetical protein
MGNSGIREYMGCFLQAGARKKQPIFPPTTGFPKDPISNYKGRYYGNLKLTSKVKICDHL